MRWDTRVTKVMTGKDTELDQLLADLGARRPAVSDALMARVLADAVAVQDSAQSPSVPTHVAARPLQGSLWSRIAAAVGGGKVLAGLGSAAIAGVALGFAQPAPLAILTSAIWGQGLDISVDLLPADDDFLAEG
jgi:hypothetical protein